MKLFRYFTHRFFDASKSDMLSALGSSHGVGLLVSFHGYAFPFAADASAGPPPLGSLEPHHCDEDSSKLHNISSTRRSQVGDDSHRWVDIEVRRPIKHQAAYVFVGIATEISRHYKGHGTSTKAATIISYFPTIKEKKNWTPQVLFGELLDGDSGGLLLEDTVCYKSLQEQTVIWVCIGPGATIQLVLNQNQV